MFSVLMVMQFTVVVSMVMLLRFIVFVSIVMAWTLVMVSKMMMMMMMMRFTVVVSMMMMMMRFTAVVTMVMINCVTGQALASMVTWGSWAFNGWVVAMAAVT